MPQGGGREQGGAQTDIGRLVIVWHHTAQHLGRKAGIQIARESLPYACCRGAISGNRTRPRRTRGRGESNPLISATVASASCNPPPPLSPWLLAKNLGSTWPQGLLTRTPPSAIFLAPISSGGPARLGRPRTRDNPHNGNLQGPPLPSHCVLTGGLPCSISIWTNSNMQDLAQQPSHQPAHRAASRMTFQGVARACHFAAMQTGQACVRHRAAPVFEASIWKPEGLSLGLCRVSITGRASESEVCLKRRHQILFRDGK